MSINIFAGSESIVMSDSALQRYKTTQRVTLIGALTNIFLALAQLLAGMYTHSQALVADGVHTLSDLFSDFLVMVAAHEANKEADDDHPYGHGRIETIATVLLGTILFLVGCGIAFHAIDSFLDQQHEATAPAALGFAMLAIALKEGLFHYTIRSARKIRSKMLEANAWHHRSDAISSLIVTAGIGAELLGVPHMDKLAAIVVALFVMRMGVVLIWQALRELIDTALDSEKVQAVSECIEKVDGVYGVHHLRSRSMAGQGYIDAHVLVNSRISVSEGHQIAVAVEQSVKQHFDEIHDVTIHIDPEDDDEDAPHQHALPTRSKLLFELYSSWEPIQDSELIQNVHLHYLNGQIDLDIILPYRFGQSEGQSLREALRNSVESIDYIGRLSILFAEPDAL